MVRSTSKRSTSPSRVRGKSGRPRTSKMSYWQLCCCYTTFLHSAYWNPINPKHDDLSQCSIRKSRPIHPPSARSFLAYMPLRLTPFSRAPVARCAIWDNFHLSNFRIVVRGGPEHQWRLQQMGPQSRPKPNTL